MDRSSEVTVEAIKREYGAAALQMQCPLHQKNARVEVEGNRLDGVEIEVFCCCEKFAERVRHALEKSTPPTAKII